MHFYNQLHPSFVSDTKNIMQNNEQFWQLLRAIKAIEIIID